MITMAPSGLITCESMTTSIALCTVLPYASKEIDGKIKVIYYLLSLYFLEWTMLTGYNISIITSISTVVLKHVISIAQRCWAIEYQTRCMYIGTPITPIYLHKTQSTSVMSGTKK